MNSRGEASRSKGDWRRMLLEQRRARDETTRSAQDEALDAALVEWISEHRMTTLCGYVPLREEPGSIDLLDHIRATGCRVLLPVVVGAAPLDWSPYSGRDSLRRARFGLLEPTGPRLGPEAIAEAEAVLVPALAVDYRGMRLGRGGGHYDRSLPLVRRDALLIALVHDAEFVDRLPGEDHDVRVDAVVTPQRGVVRLPL